MLSPTDCQNKLFCRVLHGEYPGGPGGAVRMGMKVVMPRWEVLRIDLLYSEAETHTLGQQVSAEQ